MSKDLKLKVETDVANAKYYMEVPFREEGGEWSHHKHDITEEIRAILNNYELKGYQKENN